jgi:vacuolar protein sorting-associated protein 18
VIKSLQEYKEDIKKLQEEMVEATTNANLIREDIKDLKQRYGVITKNANCSSENCKKSIVQKEFYIFPCQHMFHTLCLINEIKKFPLDEKIFNVDKIMKIWNERSILMKQIKTENQNNVVNLQLSLNEKNKLLDDLIGLECPLCGFIQINSIDKSFLLVDDFND